MPIKKRLVSLGSELFEYTLRLSRRSRLVRLSVHQDGRIVVSGPRQASVRLIEKFIVSKANWIVDQKKHLASLPKPIQRPTDRKDYLKHREQARSFVLDRIAHFNLVYQQKFGRLFIRNQRTRWGSCSSRRNLSFNYRVVHLPVRLADYIIVHELCHLIELNHSDRFWKQVEKTMPDYKKIKQELRRHKIILD